jgi:hypothetical protein
MMRRTFFGAAVLALLLLLGTSRAAEAQGLASLAAPASASSMTVDKQPACWGCIQLVGIGACQSGHDPGFLRCSTTFVATCAMSNPCGSNALLPIDLDGAAQYVSRGSRLGIPVIMREGDPNVMRNCQGAMIARFQSPDEISDVRMRTGTLTL